MSAIPRPDPRVLCRRDAVVAALRAGIGDEAVLSEEAQLAPYECDALAMAASLPMAVVLPRNTEEVSRTMQICHQHKVPVVPRGAGTSLAGGAVATGDAVIIGLSRLREIISINLEAGIANVQAGVTNRLISEAVEHKGYFYAPDPSSQMACTIGGNIGTNAGGAHCLKYGVTGNNILGVTVVLPDGEVVHVGGDYEDSAGYDLVGLVCGSEGQLGIVTEATVRLLRQQPDARPVLLGFGSSADASRCVGAIMRSGMVPVAIEFMDKISIHACEQYAGCGYPLEVEAMLIVEVEGDQTEIDEQLQQIAEIARASQASEIRVSSNDEESARIWLGRKAAFGAMGQISDYIAMDGVVPIGKLPEALAKILALGEEYGLRVANVFHAGDGNLHPLIMYDATDASSEQTAEQLGAAILKACVDMGGCLSGEHGIGLEKRDLMPYQFTDEELQQQMEVRALFDTAGRMNHAKVFPLPSAGAGAGAAAGHR